MADMETIETRLAQLEKEVATLYRLVIGHNDLIQSLVMAEARRVFGKPDVVE